MGCVKPSDWELNVKWGFSVGCFKFVKKCKKKRKKANVAFYNCEIICYFSSCLSTDGWKRVVKFKDETDQNWSDICLFIPWFWI